MSWAMIPPPAPASPLIKASDMFFPVGKMKIYLLRTSNHMEAWQIKALRTREGRKRRSNTNSREKGGRERRLPAQLSVLYCNYSFRFHCKPTTSERLKASLKWLLRLGKEMTLRLLRVRMDHFTPWKWGICCYYPPSSLVWLWSPFLECVSFLLS